MENQILDPDIPYIGPICGGRFSPGEAVKIQGTISASAYRFNITLQCGPETVPRDDVALQITVRLLDGYVSLNSLENGNWGEQQRGAAFPVKRAGKFEIVLMCDYSQYKIAINDKHYCEFPQRIHYDRITHLAIEGDVSVVQISYQSTRGSRLIEVPQTSTGISAPSEETELDLVKLIDATTHIELHPAHSSAFPEPPTYEAVADKNQEAIQEFSIVEAVPLNSDDSGIPPNSFKHETLDRYYWQKCCALMWGVIICIIIIFAIVISQAEKRPVVIKHLNITSNETYADNNGTFSSNATFARNETDY